MTEAEWLACEDPAHMLKFLNGEVSDRKLRLFACGCCLAVWEKAKDERFRECLHTVERFADGLASADELNSVFLRTREARGGHKVSMPSAVNEASYNPLSIHDVAAAAAWCADAPFYAMHDNVAPVYDAFLRARRSERAVQAGILVDVFGNPFRPVTCSPKWRTDTVLALARQMYEAREFGAMPILADALQDAGCDNPDVLSHCRADEWEHVRGCWVVDLVLGKE